MNPRNDVLAILLAAIAGIALIVVYAIVEANR